MERTPAALSAPHRRDAGRRESNPIYWDIDDVQFHCRIGKSTAWRLVREEGFPAPVVLGRRTLLWPRAEVIAFVEEKRDPEHYATEGDGDRRTVFTVRPSRRRAG